jgi:hypothetical protein
VKLRSKCVNEYYVPPDDCSEMSTINWDSLFNGLEEGDAIALYIHMVQYVVSCHGRSVGLISPFIADNAAINGTGRS